MKTLDLDAGNSRLKWRLLCDGVVVSCGAIVNEAIGDMVEKLPRPVDRCRLASVRSAAVNDQLCTQIVSQLAVLPWVPEPATGLGGLHLTGESPDRLGCDRWLAMVGAVAYCPGETVMVVDCGTAMTVDLICAEGFFQGGMICPGFEAMLQAVVRSADRLSLPQDRAFVRGFHKHTVPAVLSGVISMAAALVEREAQKTEGLACVLVCGGDGASLVDHVGAIDVPVVYKNDLIFKGLDVVHRCAEKI